MTTHSNKRRLDPEDHYKDQVLDSLGEAGNVAQFVSFDASTLRQRYSRVAGFNRNHDFGNPALALSELLKRGTGSINIRSFEPARPRSREFLYGLTSASEALGHLRRLASEGLICIANETLDANDGGVSGVAFAGLLEFAPDDTPRCVEKAGTSELPVGLGLRLLKTVYGFTPALEYDPTERVEFSIHPMRCGFRGEHTVLWEKERMSPEHVAAVPRWPNRFSRMLGDKLYGLLIADSLGLPVPKTTAFPRRVAPFSFGETTGTAEVWIRTCPNEQVPGKYSTRRGWYDPYRLMSDEDPDHTAIASILCQDAVDANFSGALVTEATGQLRIEGVEGSGDEFMQGARPPERLPTDVVKSVEALYGRAVSALGPVRMEWVYDGHRTWLVQLHAGLSPSSGRVIFPGSVTDWVSFNVSKGLEDLRNLVAHLPSQTGIVLEGRIGVTSHMADLLRKAHVASRLSD